MVAPDLHTNYCTEFTIMSRTIAVSLSLSQGIAGPMSQCKTIDILVSNATPTAENQK